MFVAVDPGPEVDHGKECAASAVNHAVDLSFSLRTVPEVTAVLDDDRGR